MTMRATEVFERSTSMSEIALLKQEVAELPRATGSFNILLNTAAITFTLDGQDGVLIFKAEPDQEGSTAQQVLKNKITAVGRVLLGGKKPRDLYQISKLMERNLSHRAIAVLMNGLTLVGARYREINFGAR